jgi:hypothetical protein
VKFLPELGRELWASIRHNFLRCSMQAHYLGHIQLYQFSSWIGCLDWNEWATFINRSTMIQIELYPAWVRGNPTMKSILISSHFHSGIFKGCSNPAGLWCSTFTLWQVSQRDTYSTMSLFIPYHQYRVFKSLYILVLPGWIEYVESWASRRISSLRCFRLGTHIRFPNHRVPWLSSKKALALLSLVNCHISYSFASSSCLSQISTSKVGSTSIMTVASFTIVRLRYLISLRNSGCIHLAKVAL